MALRNQLHGANSGTEISCPEVDASGIQGADLAGSALPGWCSWKPVGATCCGSGRDRSWIELALDQRLARTSQDQLRQGFKPLQARQIRGRRNRSAGKGVQGGQLPEFRRYRGIETTAVLTPAVIPITQPEALRG